MKKENKYLQGNSAVVAAERYYRRDTKGNIIENDESMFRRVSSFIAEAERKYGASDKRVKEIDDMYFNLMINFEFEPNSPTFFNAGTDKSMLSACFVLTVPDDMAGIFETLKKTALIHQFGGGTGFDFSELRSAGTIIGSTGNKSKGPIPFIEVYSKSASIITAAGKRDGANMGILRADHPDIESFITMKAEDKKIHNFNISVGIIDKFMLALENNEDFNLVDPHTKKVVKTVKAKKLWDLIVYHAWSNGEPGLVFLDEINRFNPTPNQGQIQATNPCFIVGTKVCCNSGLKNIEKITLNDKVLTKEGTYVHPTFAGKTGHKEVFKITLNSGFNVTATMDQKFLVKETEEWKKLQHLSLSDSLILKTGQFGKLEVPEEQARILGWLVGDGFIREENRIVFCFNQSDDLEMLDYVQNYIAELRGKAPNKPHFYENHQNVNLKYGKEVRDVFTNLGYRKLYAHESEVPSAVFLMNQKSVANFLSGLFGADGSVQGTAQKGISIRLSSNSPLLLEQVQMLLWQFEIYSKIYFNRRKEGIRMMPDSNRNLKEYHCRAQHELVISRESMFKFMEQIGFCLESKNKKFQLIKPQKIYKDNVNTGIKSIEYIDTVDVYDLIEPTTHSFVANGIISHNCGEQPLLSGEACNLGSINLKSIVGHKNDKPFIDWEKLERIVTGAVRFLDNVVDMNVFPVQEITDKVLHNRKIGLGIMGFADLLVMMGVPYDSKKALKLADEVMKFINEKAINASIDLAKERGEFPGFKGSIFDSKDAPKRRNATVTTIAPTGTISILTNCTGGIEPIFAISFKKRVLGGKTLIELHPIFVEIAKKRGFYSEELLERIDKNSGRVTGLEEVPEDVQVLFKTANEIPVKQHIEMQAAFQQHICNAVSKTINLAMDATIADVNKAFKLAYKKGCKGITVYRDGSRTLQVYSTNGTKKTKSCTINEVGHIRPRQRPDITMGQTDKQKIGCGNLYITVNHDENETICEILTKNGKIGGCSSLAEGLTRSISLNLRCGVAIDEIIRQLRGIRCTACINKKGVSNLSCPDAIGRVIEKEAIRLKKMEKGAMKRVEQEIATVKQAVASENIEVKKPVCNSCQTELRRDGGCQVCLNCGDSKCG